MSKLLCCLLVVALAFCVFSDGALAVSITTVSVTNSSSSDDLTPPSLFQTQSSLSSISNAPTSATFTHRMAFYNGLTASGGVAQINLRNVTYQIDFTVDDPSNQGFEVSAASLLRGISAINQTSDGGTALATGASFGVELDDSTDAPDTWIDLLDLFNAVDGASVNGINSATFTDQNAESAYIGAYVGTTTFSLRFSTVFTPTTNILFQNGQTGFGEVDYGLGTLAAGLSIDPDALGHFVTLSVAFVPEPSGVVLFALGISALGIARVRRKRSWLQFGADENVSQR